MTDDVYTGPDRGHFKTIRLMDDTGVKQHAMCRIKNANVFNYMTDLKYAIVGYTIEYWDENGQPPHDNGVTALYQPKGRPNFTTLYFRTKQNTVMKILHLEDAIINDFLNSKVLADPMLLNSFAVESADQIQSQSVWRSIEGTNYQYAEALHITRFDTTPTTPLTLTEEKFTVKTKVNGEPASAAITAILEEYKFTGVRDCYDIIKQLSIQART